MKRISSNILICTLALGGIFLTSSIIKSNTSTVEAHRNPPVRRGCHYDSEGYHCHYNE